MPSVGEGAGRWGTFPLDEDQLRSIPMPIVD